MYSPAITPALVPNNPMSDWLLDEDFIADVIQRSRNVDIVSFDIFDTALTRIRHECPVDVFAEVEDILIQGYGEAAAGFAVAREQAERNARERLYLSRNAEEISFSDIYDDLSRLMPQFKALHAAAEWEFEVERSTLKAVPDILELTKRLQEAGVAYAFVSDMYLPRAFLSEVLAANDYTDWSKLFVSSEVGSTKSTGKIWDSVLPQLGENVLHIGDSESSDVAMPLRRGVQTLGYYRAVSPRRTVKRFGPSLVPGSRLRRQSELSVRCGSVGSRSSESTQDQWKTLGQTFGVLVLGHFVQWLEQQIQNYKIDRLYFCARDGFLIKQAWEASGLADRTRVETSYLSVSRMALNVPAGLLASTPARLDAQLIEFLCSATKNTLILQALKRSGLSEYPEVVSEAEEIFGDMSTATLSPENIGNFEGLLRRHSAKVFEALAPVTDHCISYLRQEGLYDGGRCAIVDMGWHGTLQRSLRSLLSSTGGSAELFGFYYGLWPAASGNRYKTGPMESCFATEFLPLEEQAEVWLGVPFLEELHSPAHGSVVQYTTDSEGVVTPVVQHSPSEEAQHKRCTEWFQEGVAEGLHRLFSEERSFPVFLSEVSRDAALSAMDALFLSPTKQELEMLAEIGHCATFDHAQHEPIISRELPADELSRTNIFDGSKWSLGQVRLWWEMADAFQRIWIREFAHERFAHLGERVLRQFD